MMTHRAFGPGSTITHTGDIAIPLRPAAEAVVERGDATNTASLHVLTLRPVLCNQAHTGEPCLRNRFKLTRETTKVLDTANVLRDVDVVIHSYRHRFSLVAGDPGVQATEERLAMRVPIAVPTVVLHGADNGVTPASSSERHAGLFTGRYERRVIPVIGHNVPQEAPREFAEAILALL
jgi:pimeloyl-ACP methyl ester carboxylesterase